MALSKSTMGVKIALRFFPTGGRAFQPGDNFPYSDLAISDRRVMQMEGSRHIGDLTRENYARARVTSGSNYIGKGFTEDGLIAMGIIDAPGEGSAAPAAPAAPAQSSDKPDWSPPADQFTHSERYNDYWLAGNKNGVAVRYDVFNLKGDRLNTASLNGKKKAQAEADVIAAEAAKNAKIESTPALFPDFPPVLADWSDDQLAEFDAWFADLPGDDTPHVLLPAGAERFKILLERGNTPEPTDYASMDDDALIKILTDAGLPPKGDEIHDDLVLLAQMVDPSTSEPDSDTPDEEQQGDDDGRDLQSRSE